MKITPDDDDRLYTESHQEGWFRFKSPLRYLLLIIILVCLVIGLWYLLSPTRRSYETATLALIHADEKPFKVKAEDQGIPYIEHQDKLVYGRISGEKKEDFVEHILPDPEAPLDALIKVSPLKMVQQYLPEDPDPEDNIPSSAQPPQTVLSSIDELLEDIPAETQVSEKKEKSVEKRKEKLGTVFVQLGSLKSYDLAESEWTRLSKKHPNIFSGLHPTIQKVDLGATRGIYHRLRTGPFENQGEAKKFCTSLKENKVECVVIP